MYFMTVPIYFVFFSHVQYFIEICSFLYIYKHLRYSKKLQSLSHILIAV